MSIRFLVENKTKLDYQALTTALISEFGINDPVNWEAVIPANVQQNLFGGETLRLFSDHPHFATQKDIRTIALKKGQTSQLLILFAKLKDEKLSKANIEKITKKFIGGSAAERYVVWFVGNPSNTQFKVVISGKEGKKIVLKTLPFGVNQPYYKTYDFILEEVHRKVGQFFVEPNELWKALWKSFDISVVNKKFYLDIKSAFDSLINNDVFKGSIRIEEARKQFAVRLIGRIIFSWFLKKKDIVSESVLSSSAVNKYENYYLEFLEKLFFEVFNTPKRERGKLPDEIKDYPFLNGGLFEAQAGDFGDYKGNVFINNEWFFNLFSNTLEKYNFTIDENTSSSSEIAIDPEMLGRIFENLLAEQNPETHESARKSTGSYYTPREIVDYMVEQSISEYLKSNVTLSEAKSEDVTLRQAQDDTSNVIARNEVTKQSLEQFIEDFVHTEEFPDQLKPYATQILEKLNSVKVLDPACGSGAFPIGMLQKLIALKTPLTLLRREPVPTSREAKGEVKDSYKLKLDTILNSIYGCDIQPMAVELSRLRCWLSLIIDEEVDKKKENWGIDYLPNLDFKFVCVNTLIGLPKMEQDSLGTSADDFEKLKKLREEFFTASAKRKLQIEKEFTQLQQTVAEKQREWSTKNTEAVTMLVNWNPFKVEKTDWFDPFWMFGIKDGFDLVIGNPPYITIALGKKQKIFSENEVQLYKTLYKDVFEYKGNTFALFIQKSINSLKKAGILSFIIPNTLLLNSTFQKSRNYLLSKGQLKYLVNITAKVFESAEIGGNLVFVFQRERKIDYSVKAIEFESISSFEKLDYKYIPIKIYLSHPSNNFLLNTDTLSLEYKIKTNSISLGELANFYNGIKTGNNKRFLSDKKLNNKYFPVIRGKDISKYHIEFGNVFVLFDKELLWSNCNEEYLTKRPKILIRQTSDCLCASYDNSGYMSMDTTHLIFDAKIDLKYILALLNSNLLNWYYQKMVVEVDRPFAEVKIVNLKKLPIKTTISKNQLSYFSLFVDKIILAKQQNPKANTKHLEDQIDIMVYKLYNLTYEEASIIDPQIGSIISKEKYERFEIK